MRALILTVAIVTVLTACKPTPSQTATPEAAPASTTAAAAAPMPTAPSAETVAPADASPAATGPAASDDGRAQVNQSIEEVLGDPAVFEPAILAFQKAVAAHDADAVARMAAYPFSATVDGKPSKIQDAAAFVAAYDKIVTPAIAKIVTEQKYAELFVNGKGVMFGNGEVWLNGICRDNACKTMDVRVVAVQTADGSAAH